MRKWSIYYLSLLICFTACGEHEDLYFRRSGTSSQNVIHARATDGSDVPAATPESGGAFSITLPSDSLSPEDLSKLFVEGSFRYYQGSPAHQLILSEGLSLDPNSALLHRELGVAYLKRGIADQFPRYYGKAAELDPISWQGWRAYLYLYFYRDYQRAIDDCNELDPLTPNFVDHPQSTSVDYMRGLAHHQLGEYAVARSYIDRHMGFEFDSGDPRYINATSWLLSALNYRALDKVTEALDVLDRSISWGSQIAELHYYRALVLQDLGRVTEARQALQSARDGFSADWRLERPYVEEFFQVYEEDLTELAEKLN